MTTKEKSPWIRVSEQLPEDGELVLTRLEMHDFEPKQMFIIDIIKCGIQKTEKIWFVL